MSLEVYLQTFKCLSRLDAGILWLGLIGQCTNFEVLTLYTIREKTNLTKPTLRPVKCKYVVYTQKLTCMYVLSQVWCWQILKSRCPKWRLSIPFSSDFPSATLTDTILYPFRVQCDSKTTKTHQHTVPCPPLWIRSSWGLARVCHIWGASVMSDGKKAKYILWVVV